MEERRRGQDKELRDCQRDRDKEVIGEKKKAKTSEKEKMGKGQRAGDEQARKRRLGGTGP